MKERPILMTGPMVRAILSGAKTQTRRIMKPQPTQTAYGWQWDDCEWTEDRIPIGNCELAIDRCPYGQPGDRLWVRETWATFRSDRGKENVPVFYRADHGEDKSITGGWRPSIHMPRWASRITLEIVRVRVEKIQDISEEDAKAEGVMEWAKSHCATDNPHGLDALGYFELMWSSISGRESWDRNDWTWCLEFRRIEK